MTTMPDPVGDAPTHDEIRRAIERIAASDVFVRSPQLGAFLRFVAEAVLQGKAGRIKAYTIGIKVLRRDIKFDPQLDPIVRVEATRLRRAIERYYAGPGADDPVIVDLPRGSYVPTFRRREANPRLIAPLAGRLERLAALANRPPTLAHLVAVAAVAIAVMSGVIHIGMRPVPNETGTAYEARQSEARAGSLGPSIGSMPSIVVEPLRVIGLRHRGVENVQRLQTKIGDAIAGLDTVWVAAVPHRPQGASDSEAPLPPADYRLSGAVDVSGGRPSVSFQLIDENEGAVIWSRAFETGAKDGPGSVDEVSIVVALADALLQSNGVICARAAPDAGGPRYRCVLQAADAIPSVVPSNQGRARNVAHPNLNN
jgi:hypothetical protein